MSEDSIDYDRLAQEAMRGVVRTVLTEVALTGVLPGSHHFFIAFNTRAEDVGLSKRLREQYPDEMTIVLQHRFYGLQVHDDRFEVKLTFNGIPELLVVPFRAIKVFFDPSVSFSLQFEQADAPTPPQRRRANLEVINQDDSVQDDPIDEPQPLDQLASEFGDDAAPAREPAAGKKTASKRPQLAEKRSPRRDVMPVAGPPPRSGEARPMLSSVPAAGGSAAETTAGAAAPSGETGADATEPKKPTADVVSLDAFRKK